MGKRAKHSAERLRHAAPAAGTHVDKYAAKRPAKTAPPPKGDERSADEESEAVLASLPGGTPNERWESARRGLFQRQEAFQTPGPAAATPPRGRDTNEGRGK